MTQCIFHISDFAVGQARLFCEIHFASIFKLSDVYLMFKSNVHLLLLKICGRLILCYKQKPVAWSLSTTHGKLILQGNN